MGESFETTNAGTIESTHPAFCADLPQIESGSSIKQYELIRVLGEGGMGKVFLARDTRLGRLVAVKIVRVSADGAKRSRWLSEARATARCNHENIVIIHEADEFNSLPYMVLEYVDGLTLRAWMKQRAEQANSPSGPQEGDKERISAAMCVELLLPVARALASAHEMGVVHRDLKPENILLAKNGLIKVVDFGIAAWLDQDERRALAFEHERGMTGTLPYMSPEALANEEIDHRTDIWAMGIILFEMALGQHPLAPFSRSHLPQIMDLDTPMPSARALLPELGALGTLIDRCLEKRKELRLESAKELVTELSSIRAGIASPLLLDVGTPFAGLLAFQEADQAKFFGRDRHIAAVLARLRFQSLVAIGGPSGAGKSSFVRAGLIPAYKRMGERRQAIVLRPGKKPLLSLGSVLADLDETTLDGFLSSAPDLNAGPEALATLLRERPGLFGTVLRASCRARGPRSGTLLFVDQFEELLTLCPDPAERDAFLSCLEGAADDAASPLRVVLAVRSDFLDRLADDRKLSEDLTRGLFFLPPLDEEGLREALTKPVEALGYRYESVDLVERMLAALERTPAPLPLLQFTAAKLWEARDVPRRLLTESAYEGLGGVEGTLASHADTVVASMSPRDKEVARRFFERLVTPERTRAMASEADLQELAADPAEAERVLTRLVDARLLIAEKTESGVTVEIVHESLIARWPMLSRWLDENKEDADFLARLRTAARQWQQTGKPRGLLWRDEAMLEARRFRERSRMALSRTEQEFLDAVFALGENVARRRRFAILSIAVASSVVAVVTGTLAWKEHEASEEARVQTARTRELAERANQEASRARDAARVASARDHEDDPTLALALLREVETPAEMNVFPWMAARAARRTIAEAVLPGHDGQVWTAEISPDGRHAVTTAGDFAFLWDVRGFGPPKVLRGHTESVWRATYSPDGSRILTASWDKTARIWPAAGGDPVILEHPGRVSWAAWSPDGKRVVTAGWDPAAYVFSADGSDKPLVLKGHAERLRRASFSPDGTRVATASLDDTARVWQLDGSRDPVVLEGHTDNVVDAVFSPDGTRVATISADHTARIFMADGSGQPRVLQGHTKGLTSVAWSPDGKRLATASNDFTARVWRMDSEAVPVVLTHTREVRTVVFSPDGKYLLSSCADNFARLWTVGEGDAMTEIVGHSLGVEWATFSRDGKRFITASGDGSARIWATEQKNAPVVFRGPAGTFPDFDIYQDNKHILMVWPGEPVARVSDVMGIEEPKLLQAGGATFLSCDRFEGKLLTAHGDGTTRLWDTDGSREPIVLPAKGTIPAFGVFAEDGARVAVAYDDGSLRVFRTDGTGEPRVLTKDGAPWVDVYFSPDSARLVTFARDEPFLRIWTMESGKVELLEGHTSGIADMTLSNDRRLSLTTSVDNTARVWTLDGSAAPVVLRGHTHKVVSGGFSPDGKRVVTASADGTLRVWNSDGSGQPMELRQLHDPPRHVIWSPDGTRIASASERMIYIWNADGAGIPLVLEGHQSRIHRIRWSPDATFLVSSSNDGTVRLWFHIDKAPSLAELSDELWRSSAFCMSPKQRHEMLSVTEEMAKKDLEQCQATVGRSSIY